MHLDSMNTDTQSAQPRHLCMLPQGSHSPMCCHASFHSWLLSGNVRPMESRTQLSPPCVLYQRSLPQFRDFKSGQPKPKNLFIRPPAH